MYYTIILHDLYFFIISFHLLFLYSSNYIMASEFVFNSNLDSSNSLTHLISDEFSMLIQDSKYYDIYSLLDSKKIKHSEFLFLNLNCCSFSTFKYDQLLFFLDKLNETTCVSVVALQETWFTSLTNLTAYETPDYQLISFVSQS